MPKLLAALAVIVAVAAAPVYAASHAAGAPGKMDEKKDAKKSDAKKTGAKKDAKKGDAKKDEKKS